MNLVVINTYAGSLLLGAKAAGANVLATMEDCGYGSDLQALNFPKVPRYEKTEDWPEKFTGVAWRDIDVIAHPPCASFSIMTAKYHDLRGTDNDNFACHRRVMDYALGNKCRSLAIESVVGAYAGGKEVYESQAIKYGYNLTFIFLNAASFGVSQWRPRVWMLFHKAKKFRVELKPKYVLLRDVLNEGPTEVEGMLNADTPNLWRKAKAIVKGTKPIGLIDTVFKKTLGIESDTELRARFPEIRGYVSGHIRFVNPDWFSTTILGNTLLAYGNRLVSREEFCDIMGFPRNYKWGRRGRQVRTYLSKGVCPPVATWILKMMDRNASGWQGRTTHEPDSDEIIDLRVKDAEIREALNLEPRRAKTVKHAAKAWLRPVVKAQSRQTMKVTQEDYLGRRVKVLSRDVGSGSKRAEAYLIIIKSRTFDEALTRLSARPDLGDRTTWIRNAIRAGVVEAV
jgi:site-specific DNA-cytosine methylase